MRLNLHRAGSGPTLVLLHGIGGRWGMWEPVLPALADGFDVIALDLPGFGESPMPAPGTEPGAGALCDLVLGSLREMGVEEFHVAGNSLGGLMALELARRGAVRSACALSPAGFSSSVETAAARGLLRAAVRLARALAPRADAVLARPRARTLLLNLFFAHPARIPAAAAAADMRAMAAAPWFDATLPTIEAWAYPESGSLGVPVTIGWGTRDRLLLPRQARRAVREIPGARLVMLPGCGHQPTWDDPRAVARVIIDAADQACTAVK